MQKVLGRRYAIPAVVVAVLVSVIAAGLVASPHLGQTTTTNAQTSLLRTAGANPVSDLFSASDQFP